MDESTRELVRDWLLRADHDLRSARALAALPEPLLDTAIYHCQQAAEKAVKAWLQSQDMPFAKTHDVEELVTQAAQLQPDFGKLTSAGSTLTPYASAFRYPGGTDEFMPGREEFADALQNAQLVYDFVVNRLPGEVRPDPKAE